VYDFLLVINSNLGPISHHSKSELRQNGCRKQFAYEIFNIKRKF